MKNRDRSANKIHHNALGTEPEEATRELHLNAIAGRQHRIVSTRRLRSLGFGSSSLSRRLKDGRLTRMHNGVYLVGPGAPTRAGRWLAAVIAAGEGALLAGRAAAALQAMHPYWGSRIDVVVPYARTASIYGVRVHRSRRLHPDDYAIEDGIPVTSPERTLVDLAAEVSPGDLKRAYERADELGLIDHRKLEEAVERAANSPGVGELRQLLGYDPTPINEVRSELERRFYRVVTAAGLPPYSRNVVVEGFEVDAYWSEAGLVVELQSLEFHTDREAFIRDHQRNAALQAAGLRVLPVTDAQVRKPAALVTTLCKLLSHPPASTM